MIDPLSCNCDPGAAVVTAHNDRSATRRCRHCFEPIESFNGYDYASRGPSWRHEKTREVYCRTTTAEPVPLACPLCRRYEPEHAPTCLLSAQLPETRKAAG